MTNMPIAQCPLPITPCPGAQHAAVHDGRRARGAAPLPARALCRAHRRAGHHRGRRGRAGGRHALLL
eukprot:scaffold29377_cov45-Phaeocystis_antarctica.AAC.2